MNVVMTGAGRFVEVQGTAEGDAVLRGRARRPARPGRARDRARSSTLQRELLAEPPAPRRRRDAAVRPRHGQPRQGARDRRACSPTRAVDVELVPRPADVPDVDETGETLEENARLKADALCDGHRPARGRRRHRARGRRPRRRARRALGPLRRRGRDLRRQRRELLLERARRTCRRERTDRAVRHRRRGPLARRPRGRRLRRRSRAPIADAPRGRRKDSATTRCSCPTRATAGPSPRWTPTRSTRLSHRGRAFRTLADGLKIVAAMWKRSSRDGSHRHRRVRGRSQGPRGRARVPRPRRAPLRRELLAAPELGGRPPPRGGLRGARRPVPLARDRPPRAARASRTR